MIKTKLESFVSTVKARFSDIDSRIAELRKREAELAEEIEKQKDDFSPKTVKELISTRTELEQISETLSRALERRKELSKELSDDISGLSTAIAKSRPASEYNTALADKVWETATALRRLIWEYQQQEQAKEDELKKVFAQLKDCYDRSAYQNYVTMLFNHAGLMPPCSQRGGANSQLIRDIAKSPHYRAAANTEFSNEKI